jgi:DUF2934 family protein
MTQTLLGGSTIMARRLAGAQLQKRLLETEGVRAMITERAHQLYVQRGAEPGNEMDDWFRAENDILQLAPFIECAFRTHHAWLGVQNRTEIHASLAQIDAGRAQIDAGRIAEG